MNPGDLEGTSHVEPDTIWVAPPPQDFPAGAEAGDLETGRFTAAGLYGASLSPGLFDPVPIVALEGVDLASGPGGPDDGLMVVDGLSVTWGRDSILDQPTPATGTLQLFDPSGTWATDADRRGLPLTIRYEGTGPDLVVYQSTFFRGRIGSPVNVVPKTVRHPLTGARIRGSLVTLPLQSILVDLANTVPRVAYPAEAMSARVARVLAASQAAGVLLGGGQARGYWVQAGSAAAPVAAADQVSLLDHWLDIYESSGSDRMAYIPDTDAVYPVQRLHYPTRRSMASLFWDGSDPLRPRANQGVYARSLGTVNPYNPIIDGRNLYLDSHALEYDPADGLTTPAKITRVALTHPNGDAAYAARTIERVVKDSAGNPTDEIRLGVRTAKTDSIQTHPGFADTALNDLEEIVRYEGGAWALEPLRYSTRRTGGFESVTHGQRLLAGYEDLTTIFLQRSWLPRYGLRPIYHVIGGDIGYSAGGWDLELNVAPPVTILPQHAITWEEIDDGTAPYTVRWWDDDQSNGMHESLTFEDLGHVGQGLNVSVVPADTGWDGR